MKNNMFVEIYNQKLTIEPGLKGKVEGGDIISSNQVVNTDHIIFADIVPTEVNGEKYHKIKLDQETVGKLYITVADFKKLWKE